MKPFLFSLLLITSGAAVAQCGKTVILTSALTEYLDAGYTVQRTVDENSSISIDSSQLIITPGDQNKMVGAITSSTCNWKQPFKEGKSVIKATFTRDGQQKMNATITIEGKDGKVTLLMDMEQMPDRKIRITANKFEEQSKS